MSFLIFASEAPNGNFLPGDINEFYWGAAAFFVVVIFMLWKVRPGVVKMFKASMQKTEKEVTDAKESAKDAENQFNELKAKLSDVNTERERILAEARVSAESVETELKAKADQDAIDLRNQASQDAKLSKLQTENEIKQQSRRAALRATEEIVLENLSPKVQARLLDKYITKDLAVEKIK